MVAGAGPRSLGRTAWPGRKPLRKPSLPRPPTAATQCLSVSRLMPVLPLVKTPNQPEDVTTREIRRVAVDGSRVSSPPWRHSSVPFHGKPLPVAGAAGSCGVKGRCRCSVDFGPVTESSAHVSARWEGPGLSRLRSPTWSRGHALPPQGCTVSQVNDGSTRIAWSRSQLPITE